MLPQLFLTHYLYLRSFQNNMAYGFIDVDEIFQITIPHNPVKGFVGYGCSPYGIADYDNFSVKESGNMFLKPHRELRVH